MKTYLDCQVVMLPTEKASSLYFSKHNSLAYQNESKVMRFIDNKSANQYLYFTSDREIKEGDWYYGQNTIWKCDGRHNIKDLQVFKKIEATTDPSLEISIVDKMNNTRPYLLPQIPESFIQAYVKANGDIKKVRIELVTSEDGPEQLMFQNNPQIKTRPDNIVIVAQERMYSREEVEKAYKEGVEFGMAHSEGTFTEGYCQKLRDKWIEENL